MNKTIFALIALQFILSNSLSAQTVGWSLVQNDQSNTPGYTPAGPTSGSFTFPLSHVNVSDIALGFYNSPSNSFIETGWDGAANTAANYSFPSGGTYPNLDFPGEFFEITVTFDTPVYFTSPLQLSNVWQSHDYSFSVDSGAVIDTSGVTGGSFAASGSGSNSIFLDSLVAGGSNFGGSLTISGPVTQYTFRQSYSSEGYAGFFGATLVDSAAILRGNIAIPEPSAMLLGLVGICLPLIRRRRGA